MAGFPVLYTKVMRTLMFQLVGFCGVSEQIVSEGTEDLCPKGCTPYDTPQATHPKLLNSIPEAPLTLNPRP